MVRTGVTATVQGVASGQVEVETRGSLVLQGTLSGKTVVHDDGTLTVQGTISSRIFNAGVVLIAGVFSGSTEQNEGRIGFAVGTIIDGDAVQEDGSLTPAAHSSSIDFYPGSLDSYRFLHPDGSLVTLDRLPGGATGQ